MLVCVSINKNRQSGKAKEIQQFICCSSGIQLKIPAQLLNQPPTSAMPRIAELASDDNISDRSKTFVFENEGHTLGNVLKAIICRYDDVLFCGYTVPHPAESIMHLRIQATSNSKAIDILRRGLEDLEKVCDHTISTFERAMDEYEADR